MEAQVFHHYICGQRDEGAVYHEQVKRSEKVWQVSACEPVACRTERRHEGCGDSHARNHVAFVFGRNGYDAGKSAEKSYEYVRAISDQFGLSIAFTQENRIDYCWHYRFKARLEFYLEYGKDENVRYEIQQLLSDEVTMGDKSVIRLAKALTPELNPIVNVEYQTMRRHSKTYQLVPFKDNSSHATSRRIYDYLDNRSIIIDYLTHQVFRYFRRITIEDNKISTHICKNIPVCTIIDVCLFYYFFYACNSMCIFPQR